MYLVGALTYDHQWSVPVVPLHGKILDEAVPSMYAHGVQGHLAAHLAGEQLGHPSLRVAPLTPILFGGGIVDQEAGGLNLRSHIGQHKLYGLVVGNALTEGLALLSVADSSLEGRRGHSYSPSSYVDAPGLQPLHHLIEAPSLFSTYKVLNGYAKVLKHQLTCVHTTVAQLVQVTSHRKAGSLFSNEGAYAPMARLRCRVGLGKQQEHIPVPPIG